MTAGRKRVIAGIAAAIVGLAALFVAEEVPTRHHIESNLEDRSLAALHRGGVANVSVRFTGRDGAVVVASAADVDRARSIVQNQEGVRVAKVTVATAAAPAPTTVAPPAPTSSSPAVSPSASPPAPSSPAPSSSPGVPTTDQVHKQIVAAGPVEFDSGSATLTAGSQPVLARIAAIMIDNPTMKLRIEGNTDSRGSASANLDLSVRRAQTVFNALQALGVAPERMMTIGYGESHPHVPNTTSANRAVNRRVSFTLTD
jgi:outer membrane protein OmpA-like peptidoglycan-associated protein